jgi:iron complex outermembrane receptor protein
MNERFRFFNPKAGLFFQLNPENALYGSIAVANREPNRSNYTDAGKVEIPQPERLIDYEFGYKFNNSNWAFAANLYYMKYKDQLVLTGKVNETGRPIMSNVPDSYRSGIELTVGARLSHSLEWNGNLTLSRNKINNYTEYVTVYGTDGNPEAEQQADYYGTTNISFSPSTIANSIFTYKYRSFTAGLQSNYVGRQYLDNTGRTDTNQTQSMKKERSVDAYFVNNLRLSYDFLCSGKKRFTLQLLVNNLFNEKYETNGWIWSCYYRQADGSLEPYTEKSYFPQAGINVMTNVSLKF